MDPLFAAQFSKHGAKLRCAAIAFVTALIFIHLYLWSDELQHVLPQKYTSSRKVHPASKLPRVSPAHQVPLEELATITNSTSRIACAGIDIDAVLHVKAATTIDPSLDLFLNDSSNYPQLGLPPEAWDEASMRERWYHMSTVSLWRPLTKTYWTANRINYGPESRLSPEFSYAWWEEWNEDITERVNSAMFSIFVPQKSTALMGPEDPRAFEDPYGHVCFFFTMRDTDGLHKLWMYNSTSKLQVALQPPAKVGEHQMEKNWTPFVHDGELKIVYTIKPLSIITCDFSSGACEFEYAADADPSPSSYHGGTNWVPYYDSGYYISVAHTQETGDWGGSVYRLSLAVLSTHHQKYRIAYASGPLDLNNITFLEPFGSVKNGSVVDAQDSDIGRIITAGSISRTLFDQNSFLVTVSTSDNSTTLLEVGGISDVMKAVISKDQNHRSWHHDDEKAVDCAEKTAIIHINDMLKAKVNAENKSQKLQKWQKGGNHDKKVIGRDEKGGYDIREA